MNRRKTTPSTQQRSRINSSNNTNSSTSRRGQQNNVKNKKFIFSRKRIITLVSAFLVIFIIFMFISQGSANIKIYAESKNQSVKKQQDITANFGATEGIKAFAQSEMETGSDSTPTTGTGKAGKAATGSVRATYLQAAGTITLKTGTSMTCSNPADCGGQALVFKTLEDHTFSLATSPVNINLQAVDNGDQYNLRTGIKFKTYDIAESDISITNVAPFTGGESHDTKIVSQKDYDDLQTRLTDTLKSTAYSKITAALGPNATILPDKVKVDVKSVKTDKKINEEGENVSMDMEVNITASAYDKTTVRPFVENLLKEDEKDNLKLDLNSVDIQQSVKSANDKSIILTIIGTGTLKPDIDKDGIRKDLQGKSLDDIKKILEKIPNISNVTYIYSPNWLPGFMKHVPDNKANINLELKEVN